MASAPRIAVVGGGWAGLAAAIEGTRRGARVSLFEMAAQLGGRARKVDLDGLALDNGQHILIGAYAQTLGLMRGVGVDIESVLQRLPLALVGPDGCGLELPPGSPRIAFARAVCAHPHWRWPERLSLLATAAGWSLRGFRCASALSVEALCARLTAAVRRELIEPLCVAALNTPAREASASVFLRVLHDALFAGPGASDLLLPRRHLGELLPEPAERWLRAHGAALHLSRRVMRIERAGTKWRIDDGAAFDAVVLAGTTAEAERLARPLAPAWADATQALRHQPIVTVYLHAQGARLARPMIALPSDEAAEPAQFVFDLGRLRGHDGVLACAVSGAERWLERGLDATAQAACSQVRRTLAPAATVLHALAERRATFACVPALLRPSRDIAPGLIAAGDYVAGPYPATLEGAVRSGIEAIDALSRSRAIPFRDAK
jgi:squalene-associated FAD-dependent desaturase